MSSTSKPNLYAQAVAHLRRGEYHQAVAVFTEVIRASPYMAKAYVGRGLAYRSLEDDAKAESDEQKAQAIYENQAKAGYVVPSPTWEDLHPATIPSLLTALRQYEIISPAQLDEIAQRKFPHARALAEELRKRYWLTDFQAETLLQERGRQLRLGPYLLLEPVAYEGGGISSPYKARQQNLEQIVLLDRLDKLMASDRKAVEDYQRKARTLDHPNVVKMLDCGQAKDAYFVVSEYSERAVDLARLVKDTGPLPVAQACDIIRQAALGLQHILEQGMIHGDLKPHDLLLMPDGNTVKIRNVGLRLVEQPDFEKNEFIQVAHLLDYVAPEQLKGSMDLRSDLYALGGTFYHLLMGHSPFVGQTLGAILVMKHLQQEPEPVEQLRPDVPPGVAVIVRKLMVHRPEDRFQTSQEVATALTW